MICREKDMKGGLVATFFCAVPSPRRWHTRVAPQALQRRFCVPSVTFLWEWNMKCALGVCLERDGCAIVLAGEGGLWDVRAGLAIRARSCNSPGAAT